MSKFKTIKASLFDKNNENNIPEWMKDINVDIQDENTLNIEFDKKQAWAENTIIRDNRDYSVKQITAKLNNNEILLSKIELSKFLKNKYYDVIDSKLDNNKVRLTVHISNIPGEFLFIYDVNNNYIKQGISFFYNDDEYPFSNAGLEECLLNIKDKKVISSVKVSNNNKASIISREEIFRRYNGHIRQATDKINELLKDGTIIGVTSNSYGTFYDIEYLFPQQEKEPLYEKAPEFEFVNNIEKTAINQKKSAYQLAMEASKQFEKVFDDFDIIGYERDGDKLNIIANVLQNNVSYNENYELNIKDEKVENIKFNNLDVNSNIKIKGLNQKRLNYKNIISKNQIKNILKDNGFFNVNINDLFDQFTKSNDITRISEDKYTSKMNIKDLLLASEQRYPQYLGNYDKNKFYKLVSKIDNYKFEREAIKDTGIRDKNNIKFSNKYRLSILSNYLSQKFKKFYIKDFEKINDQNYKANIIFIDSGKKNKLSIFATYKNSRLIDVKANLKNKKISIKDTSLLFNKTAALKKYLVNNEANVFTNKIVLTLNQIYNKLDTFIDNELIGDIIEDWISNNYIINVGGDTYTSEYTFEELIELSNINILSDEEIDKLIKLKTYFGEGQDINRIETIDTGIRETEEYVSNETLINNINKYLSKYFNEFTINGFNINENSNGTKYVNYAITVFNEDNGLSLFIHISLECVGNRIKDCFCNVDGEKISIENVKKAFIINESLNKYLTMFNGKKIKSNIIITRHSLKEKLSKISNINDESLNETIELLIKNNKLDQISLNTYASKYTLEELINFSNVKPLTDEEFLNKIKKAQHNKLLKLSKNYLHNDDTRELVDNWNENDIKIYISNKLNDIFKNYKILNFEFNKDKYIVSINATDLDGLNKTMICYFDVYKNHPGEIIKITNLNNEIQEIDEYLNYNSANVYNDKGIITQKQLENKLFNIIDLNDFDDIVNDLIENDILSPIEDNKYIMNCTMTDIIGFLSKNKKTNLIKGKNNLLNRISYENKIDTKIKQDIENDTRKLLSKDKLSKQGEDIKNNILNLTKNMYNDKKITLNKYNEINDKLNKVTNEIELNDINNDLIKYLK